MGDYYTSIDRTDSFIASYSKAIKLFKGINKYFDAAELSFRLATHTHDIKWYTESAKLYNQHHQKIEN
jgi:predicted ATPase